MEKGNQRSIVFQQQKIKKMRENLNRTITNKTKIETFKERKTIGE